MERAVTKTKTVQVTVPRFRGYALKLTAAAGIVFSLGTGCATSAPRNEVAVALNAQSLIYRFPLPDGRSIGSDELAGRWTIVLFLTTYDPVSHAIAQRLDAYQHTRTPRINVVAVAMEPPQNATLVAVFAETLAIGFPVALADQDTLDGNGPFGDVRAVPTLVLLDPHSGVVHRGIGVSAVAEIEAKLDETAKPAR
jgi:hypothetical protein